MKKGLFEAITEKALERTIINFCKSLPESVLLQAIKTKKTLLRALKEMNLPLEHKRNIYAVLGMLKTALRIYPKPDVKKALVFVLKKMQSDQSLHRILKHVRKGEGLRWLYMQVSEIINFIWG